MIHKKDWDGAIEKMAEVYDTIIKGAGNINRYNYRDFGEYDTTFISKFLDSDKVKGMLNVPTGVKFTDLNTTIN